MGIQARLEQHRLTAQRKFPYIILIVLMFLSCVGRLFQRLPRTDVSSPRQIEVQVEDTSGSAPGFGLDDLEFEKSRELFPVVPISFLNTKLVNKLYRQTQRAPVNSSIDGVVFPEMPVVGHTTKLVKLHGKKLLFASRYYDQIDVTVNPFRPPITVHELSFIGDGYGATPVVLFERLEGSEDYNLEYDVLVQNEIVYLAYLSSGNVNFVTAEDKQGGLILSNPRVIYSSQKPIRDLRLCTTRNRLHLVWTSTRSLGDSSNDSFIDYPLTSTSVLYAHSEDWGKTWTKPKILSQSARANSLDIVCSDNEIYAAWADQRYAKIVGGLFSQYLVNDSKLVFIRAEQEGDSFFSPVTITDPHNEEIQVSFWGRPGPIFVTLANSHPIVIWWKEPNPKLSNGAPRGFDLHPDVRPQLVKFNAAFDVVKQSSFFDSKDLEQAFQRRMRSVHSSSVR